MQCPFCFSNNTKCINSREVDGSRRRRYECNACEKRFSTKEIYLDMPAYANMQSAEAPQKPKEEKPSVRKTRKLKSGSTDDSVDPEPKTKKKKQSLLRLVEISDFDMTVRKITKEEFRRLLTKEMNARKACKNNEGR